MLKPIAILLIVLSCLMIWVGAEPLLASWLALRGYRPVHVNVVARRDKGAAVHVTYEYTAGGKKQALKSPPQESHLWPDNARALGEGKESAVVRQGYLHARDAKKLVFPQRMGIVTYLPIFLATPMLAVGIALWMLYRPGVAASIDEQPLRESWHELLPRYGPRELGNAAAAAAVAWNTLSLLAAGDYLWGYPRQHSPAGVAIASVMLVSGLLPLVAVLHFLWATKCMSDVKVMITPRRPFVGGSIRFRVEKGAHGATLRTVRLSLVGRITDWRYVQIPLPVRQRRVYENRTELEPIKDPHGSGRLLCEHTFQLPPDAPPTSPPEAQPESSAAWELRAQLTFAGCPSFRGSYSIPVTGAPRPAPRTPHTKPPTLWPTGKPR